MTPEVAERAANISKAYPNLDPKLVMYGSLLGVEHDSNLALELASRQNNVTIKNNQKALQSEVEVKSITIRFVNVRFRFSTFIKKFK